MQSVLVSSVLVLGSVNIDFYWNWGLGEREAISSPRHALSVKSGDANFKLKLLKH